MHMSQKCKFLLVILNNFTFQWNSVIVFDWTFQSRMQEIKKYSIINEFQSNFIQLFHT